MWSTERFLIVNCGVRLCQCLWCRQAVYMQGGGCGAGVKAATSSADTNCWMAPGCSKPTKPLVLVRTTRIAGPRGLGRTSQRAATRGSQRLDRAQKPIELLPATRLPGCPKRCGTAPNSEPRPRHGIRRRGYPGRWSRRLRATTWVSGLQAARPFRHAALPTGPI